MNNEINKSHEDILDKYKRTFDNVHYWYQREEILQAMAEVAGLRDKEVERLERVIRKMDADAVSAEKDIEQLKAKTAEMSAFVNPLKDGWHGDEHLIHD